MDHTEKHEGDAASIIEVATIAAEPHALEASDAGPLHYAVAVPPGGSVQHLVIDDERHLPEPRRKKGLATLTTVESFVSYVKARSTDAMTIWLDEQAVSITAVFNDDPGWRDHRAQCGLTLTEEWQRWSDYDGKLLDQQAFAELIEDGLDEIRVPDAADMLEIAQTFQSHLTAEFRAGTRLTSGQVQFRYEETETAQAGTKGELEIPELIKLGIPVFLGEDAYEIEARFRHRARGGDLKLGYKLVHPERVLRDAIELIGVRLASEFDGEANRVFLGAAPAAA